jgi:hypothetical protein
MKVARLGDVLTAEEVLDARLEHLRFSHETSGAKEYRKQGRLSLYSKANLTKRNAARHDPQVLDGIMMFFNVFQSPEERDDGCISKQEMLDVTTKICKALFDPDEWDLHEAQTVSERDWNSTVGIDGEFMSQEEFTESLFETVDIWTEEVVVSEYVAFLHNLFARMTNVGEDGEVWYVNLALYTDTPTPPTLTPHEDLNACAASNLPSQLCHVSM